ncbi:hypothetical protein SRHO_G00023400 [Serrasalmus rhombeus]
MEGLVPPSALNLDFDNLAKSWKSWKEEFTLYLELAMPGAEETTRVKLFYYLIGEKGRELCNTLSGDDAEARKTVSKMIELFDGHCNPKLNETVERYRFFVRNQGQDESIDKLVNNTLRERWIPSRFQSCLFFWLFQDFVLFPSYKVVTVTILNRILAREDEADTGIKTMKKTLLQAVNNHCGTVEDEPVYALATLLEPRYKDRYFTSAESAKYAIDALTKELEEFLKNSGALETSEPPEKSPRVEAAAAPDKSSFMKESDQILEECEDPGTASSSNHAVDLHRFFTEKTITASDSPYQYWRVNKD